MTFWCGSGSTDAYLRLMDPTLTPDFAIAIFVSDLQEGNKIIFFLSFLLFTFFEKLMNGDDVQ